MMRRTAAIILIVLLGTFTGANARGKKTNAADSTALQVEASVVLDSNYVKRVKMINDYTMLGVQYGVALSTVNFDPVRSTSMTFQPVNVGVLYTRYGKIFGYMPYFGIQMGVFYTKESYKFQKPRTGMSDYILGATRATIQTVEVPVMAHLHFDFWKMKILVNVGPYLGYRLSVERSEYVSTYPESYNAYTHNFHPNENRMDYGIKAGAGLGLVFDPIEIHLTGAYKYSLSNLHQPNVNARSLEHDDNSKYYYKWSYPSNIIIAVGIHYQITRRSGYTRKEIKQQAEDEARELYKKALNSVSQEYENHSKSR